MNLSHSGPWAEKARFGLALALIAASFLWGGGSRLDIPGLIILQPLTILIGAGLVLLPGEMRWSAIRTPLILLAALALVMIVQLIPLPPALWRELPGHAQYLPFIESAGVGSVWRPLSLTPDLTLASLIGLGTPAAGLIAFASLPQTRTQQLLPYLLIAVVFSSVFGLGQLVGGPDSAFYRYAVTNEGAAVGLFSNRNHQGLFIAMAWPMLAIWVTAHGLEPPQKRLRRWIGGVGAVALVPLVLATGSRAGLVLGVIGLLSAGLLIRAQARSSGQASILPGRAGKAMPVLVLLAVGAAALLSMLFSRDEAIQRFSSTNMAEEQRLSYLPVVIRITGDFLPFGSGFGSFDPVFRHYEPNALLRPTYLNHAHNDWLELVLTGGLPSALIGLMLLVWVVRKAAGLRGRLGGAGLDRFGYLGAVMIVLSLLASTADYPLRTPIHALLFAFACGWLAALPGGRRSRDAV